MHPGIQNSQAPTMTGTLRKFHQFSKLSDDLQTVILTFVADVPYESNMEPKSSLTHTLPLISKNLCALIQKSDFLWRDGLVRLTKAKPLWEEGLQYLISDLRAKEHIEKEEGESSTVDVDVEEEVHTIEGENATTSSQPIPHPNLDDAEDLVKYAQRIYSLNPAPHSNPDSLFQSIFQNIVLYHLHYNGNVFFMPGAARLDQEIGLHFFEPRYRLMMSEAMSEQPLTARLGGPIVSDSLRDFPGFIYAHKAPLERNALVFLVRVVRCFIHPDGSADVNLVPYSYARIKELWKRPGTGRLYAARVVRLGREDARRSVKSDLFSATVFTSVMALLTLIGFLAAMASSFSTTEKMRFVARATEECSQM